jgi:hypothetical protein
MDPSIRGFPFGFPRVKGVLTTGGFIPKIVFNFESSGKIFNRFHDGIF